VRKALEGKEHSQIKAALEALQKEVYEMSAKLYKEAGPTPPPGGESPKPEEGKTVDAEYEVKEDK